MSSTPSTTAPNSKKEWPAFASYCIPPLAASVAIVPAFPDMVAKSFQQKGQPVPAGNFLKNLKSGIQAAPTVGTIVGMQMILQTLLEKAFTEQSEGKTLYSTFASSAVTGTISAPVLAVFNGQTMGQTPLASLLKFSPRQGFAIAVQETAFVGGLAVADHLAESMRERFGKNKIVDYTAAFFAGAGGSLAGHPANTALTRWQSGMTVDTPRQLMWGSLRKARAVGGFSVVYAFVKEVLNSAAQSSNR